MVSVEKLREFRRSKVWVVVAPTERYQVTGMHWIVIRYIFDVGRSVSEAELRNLLWAVGKRAKRKVLLDSLVRKGFVKVCNRRYVLTSLGEEVVGMIDVPRLWRSVYRHAYEMMKKYVVGGW